VPPKPKQADPALPPAKEEAGSPAKAESDAKKPATAK